jgi:hypothetical protein
MFSCFKLFITFFLIEKNYVDKIFLKINENISSFVFDFQFSLNNVQEILVPFASAQRLSGNNYYKIEDANHLTICKPPTREHISYSKLVDYLKICLKVRHQLQCKSFVNHYIKKET